MDRLRTHEPDLVAPRTLRREGFRALVRRPMVQLALGVAAAVQVAAVNQTAEMARASEPKRLAPVVVALREDADGGAPVEEIVEEYREQGYELTPELAADIHEAAADNGIDPEVAFGLVRAESSFRNAATSTVGAVGLTQLMPSTARWLEPGTTRSELRDPETNLRIGFRYLRQLIDKYEGDVDLALVAYNRGPGTVDRALKRGRDPDNGYADFVRGKDDHGHSLFTK